MMRLAPLGLVAVLALVPQDVSPEEELERLAEVVAELEEFSVTYTIESDAQSGHFAYHHRGSYEAAFTLVLDDGTDYFVWFDGSHLTMLTTVDDETTWAAADVGELFYEWKDVFETLCETFDELGRDPPEELQPTLHVHVLPESEDNVFSATLAVADGLAERFCWYAESHRSFEDVTLEADHVVLHGTGDRVLRIARDEPAGFLYEASGTTDEGETRARLAEFHDEVDEDALVAPECPDDAEDTSENLVSRFGRWGVRHQVFIDVRTLLDEEEIDWDEDTRERLGEVLEVLHRHSLPSYYEDWIEEWITWIQELADGIEASLEHPDADVDALRAYAAEARGTVEAAYTQLQTAYLDWLAGASKDDGAENLYEVERETVRGLFAEEIEAPLIEEFELEVESLFPR